MKMDNTNKMSALDILKRLQKLVKLNTVKIKSNNKYIKKIIHEGDFEKMNDALNKITVENKKLTDENTQYLELHTRLLCFVKATSNNSDQKNISSKKISKPSQYHIDDYLDKTVMGELKFNKQHPLFHNKLFRGKLIDYYSGIEEYEICAELQRI